jgi:hypothetical protein
MVNAVFGSYHGVFVAGDWQNGSLYCLDSNYFHDDATEVTFGAKPTTTPAPINWIRTFHHIGRARAQGTEQPGETDGRRIKYNYFYADMDGGQIPLSADGNPQVTLRWSDDRGNTWLNGVMQPYGPAGNFGAWPTWRTLGISRDRIFELSFSSAGPTALNGAWIDGEVLDS